ncbi:hypothetical protein IJT93_12370 [bacterium]|nr:hypothetical protein [bacterium]
MLFNYGFNVTNGQTNGTTNYVYLDVSSDFEQCAVPYRFRVIDVPSNLSNTLIFETDDNEKYSVKGVYDSDSRTMNYRFKSPADNIYVTYIRIGDQKSTERLNALSPTLTDYMVGEAYFSYEGNMGTKGNKKVNFGCPNCYVPGSGSDLTGDLKAGNGVCRVCRGLYPNINNCTNCHHDGKCRSCCKDKDHIGICIGFVGIN